MANYLHPSAANITFIDTLMVQNVKVGQRVRLSRTSPFYRMNQSIHQGIEYTGTITKYRAEDRMHPLYVRWDYEKPGFQGKYCYDPSDLVPFESSNIEYLFILPDYE